MESTKHYADSPIYDLAYGNHIFRSSNWDTQSKNFLFGVWVTHRCEKQPKDFIDISIMVR